MAFEILISDTASVQDTIDLIIKTVNQHSQSKFIQDFCTILKPEKDEAFLRKLFDAVCHYIKYQRDPVGNERVKTPKRLFVDAFKGIEGGDCKKMSTAIASLLKCANIEPLLKVISYDGKSWAHIYVICKVGNQWYTLDPVNDCKFNSEIPHAAAIVYNLKGNSMNLSLLGGQDVKQTLYGGIEGVSSDIDNVSASLFGDISMGCPGDLSGSDGDDLLNYYVRQDRQMMGNIFQKIADKAKAVINKVVDAVKTVNPVSVALRNTFLGIVKLGKVLEKSPIKMHLAQKLADGWKKDNGAKLKAMWAKWGGDADSLKKAIIIGSGTQLAGFTMYNGKQAYQVSGLGEPVTIATLTAGIALATPLLLAAKKTLSELGVIKEGSKEDVAMTETIDAGIAAHNDDGTLPTSIRNVVLTAFVPATGGGGGGGGATNVGSVTGLALVMMINEFPLYISIPITAYTLYHYRKIWTNYIPFINTK